MSRDLRKDGAANWRKEKKSPKGNQNKGQHDPQDRLRSFCHRCLPISTWRTETGIRLLKLTGKTDVCGGGVLGASKSSRGDLYSREIGTTCDWGLTEEDGGNPGVNVVDVPVGDGAVCKDVLRSLIGSVLDGDGGTISTRS